jgi:hypothetical protein
MSQIQFSFTLIGMALTATPAVAQMAYQTSPTQLQGMMSHAPAGLVVKTGSNPDSSVVRLRNVGTASTPPAQWSSTTYGAPSGIHADYSMSALQQTWPALGSLPVEFADISTGGDISPVIDSGGRMQMTDIWFGLSIMLDPNAVGEDNSLINQRRLAGIPHNGTIFSYYAEGSDGISSAYVDKVFIEQTYTQLGFTAGTTETITGLDWGMGVISVDPLRRGTVFFPSRNLFYFTVTPQWAQNAVNIIFPSINAPLNSRTVYRQTWTFDPITGIGTWGPVGIAYSSSELGLVALDAIDMISVYAVNGNDRLIFSTKPRQEVERNQLLVYQRNPGSYPPSFGPLPLRTEGDVLVTSKFGLLEQSEDVDPDNIVGGCGKDPEQVAPDRVLGVPMLVAQGTVPPSNPLGMSVLRSDLPPLNDTTSPNHWIHLGVSGTDIGSSPFGVAAIEYRLNTTTGPGAWTLWSAAVVYPTELTSYATFPAWYEKPGGPTVLMDEVDYRASLHVYQNGVLVPAGRESAVFRIRYW